MTESATERLMESTTPVVEIPKPGDFGLPNSNTLWRVICYYIVLQFYPTECRGNHSLRNQFVRGATKENQTICAILSKSCHSKLLLPAKRPALVPLAKPKERRWPLRMQRAKVPSQRGNLRLELRSHRNLFPFRGGALSPPSANWTWSGQ
jgi:hypothetical protein